MVPTCSMESTEAEALKELKEIEGLLTMFEDQDSENAVHDDVNKREDADDGGGGVTEREGASCSLAGSEDTLSSSVGQSSNEREHTQREKDLCSGIIAEDSDWESVLGDINQIEGKFRHLRGNN